MQLTGNMNAQLQVLVAFLAFCAGGAFGGFEIGHGLDLGQGHGLELGHGHGLELGHGHGLELGQSHGGFELPAHGHGLEVVSHHQGHHGDYHAHPKYQFNYAVHDPHTGDIKEHHEHRDGDLVKGTYSLKEADGTTRIVEYKADKHSGFNAVVHKIGEPHHQPQYHHHQPQILHHGGGFSGSNYLEHF